MNHDEFRIGEVFTTEDGRRRWRCTDVGRRTIVAIRIDQVDISTMAGGKTQHQTLTEAEAEDQGWFNGPPYAVLERVFDEDDQQDCQPLTLHT